MRERALVVAAGAVLVALSLAGCAPEPSTPSATASASPSMTQTPSPSAAEPSPSATADSENIALPATCEQIYSPEMLAALTAQAPPLNHPGVTMLSTQNAELLEIQHSGVPTIRCTWGTPSEFGLATNVSIVDAAQSAAIAAALRNGGFGCEEHADGTICRTDQTVITQDDTQVHRGETHFLRGNGWVSTAWINFAPTGYTEDIVATLWG